MKTIDRRIGKLEDRFRPGIGVWPLIRIIAFRSSVNAGFCPRAQWAS